MNEIAKGVVATILGGVIMFVGSSSLNLFDKELTATQLQKLSRSIVDDREIRDTLLRIMADSGEFGVKGEPGGKGNPGLRGEQGPPGPDVPLGTILAWHKNASINPLLLPAGWEESNGQVVKVETSGLFDPDGDGLFTTPNLNATDTKDYLSGYSNGAFLRGSKVSGLQQSATEIVNVFGHPSAEHRVVYVGKSYSPNGPPNSDRIIQRGGIDVNSDGIEWGQGEEVRSYASRPVNMSIVWIIRVK